MITERVTNGVAFGAMTSYGWLPSLAGVSTAASLVLTLLGIVWLATQIYFKIWRGK